MANLDWYSFNYRRSNSAEQGVWAFRIGRIADTVEEPDLNFGTGSNLQKFMSFGL